MEIFIAKNNQRTGPFSLVQLQSMVSAGMLSLTDLAWHAELPGWTPVHQVLSVCPPVPESDSNTHSVERPPQGKNTSDLLAYLFFGLLLFSCLFLGVRSLSIVVLSLGNSAGPGIEIILGPIVGVIFLSIGYTFLMAYRHFHRRYLGLIPRDYNGAFGTKMKPTEAMCGLLMGGGIFVALLSGIPFPIIQPMLMIVATVFFAFAFDRVMQQKLNKLLRSRNY